jgi:RNA polymerase sigma factor for flagellar operon FliA
MDRSQEASASGSNPRFDRSRETPPSGENPRFGQHTARASAAEVLSLWQQYKRTGDLKLRDRLIFTFTPMVRYIVYRKVREVPAQCDVEDFLSCGLEALIRSIERYDPDKGATLEQFAWTRIHGAVLDELRRHDWAPRSLRRAERTINSARESFLAEHERQPTREELAATAGMSAVELAGRIDELALADVGSLNRTIRSEDSTTIERIDTLESEDEEADPTHSAERREALERFRTAFAQLPPRERQVAVLLYVEGRTLRDIGTRLGVSESRVSQIHTELRRRLRERLASDEALFTAV